MCTSGAVLCDDDPRSCYALHDAMLRLRGRRADREYYIMKNLVESVRAAVREGNWYAALSGALALPDICGRCEDASAGGSQRRYVAWFDKYLATSYRRAVAGRLHTLLTGEDCYALRCAYSHGAEFDVSSQRARKVLAAFAFVAVPPGVNVHLNQVNTQLQLQVDLFCAEICSAVEAWLAAVADQSDIQSRLEALPKIVVAPPTAQV